MVIEFIATHKDGSKITFCGAFDSFESFDRFEKSERARPNYQNIPFKITYLE
jgi:hypothetical protein